MSSDETKFPVVFVLGPPGSGKGTQCTRISKELGWLHLSAGDLLRAEQARPGSEFGALIDGHIRRGSIVPVEITCRLLEKAMIAASEGTPGFLIDGFPRNENNLQGWETQMGSTADVLLVLFLDCSEDVCIARCLKRGQGRTDDNEESLRGRRTTYLTQTMPIIDHFQKLALVKRVDASAGPDEVFEQVKAALGKALISGAQNGSS